MMWLYVAVKSVLVLTVVTVIIWYWLKNKKRYELLNKLPTPHIGDTLQIMVSGGIHEQLARICSKGEGICRFNIFVDDWVVLTSAEYLKTFYTSRNTDRSDIYGPLRKVLYDSVFVSGGATWKERRKILLGNFFNIPPQRQLDNFRKHYGAMIRGLSKKADREFFPVLEDLQTAATHAVFVLASGDNPPQAVVDMITKVMEPFLTLCFLRITTLRFYIKSIFNLTPQGRIYQNYVKALREVFEQYIKEKMTTFNEMKQNGVEVPPTLFYIMMEKYPHLSYIDIASEAVTLVPASIDTTTSATGFVLLVLALFPEIQEKVYLEDLEVREMLDGGEPTADDMRHYKYFDLVVKETLRLFPIAQVIGRKLSEDTYFGKYLVPAQTNVMAFQGFANHSEKYFKDPLKFDPDRFLPENAANIPQYAYNPFSAGPRGCPGQKYALTALNVVVVGIVRKFKIYTKYKSLDEILSNVVAGITLKDKSSFQIRLESREKSTLS